MFADLRVLAVGYIVAMSVGDPAWALRRGAVLAGLILAVSLVTELPWRLPPVVDRLALAYAGIVVLSIGWATDEARTTLGAMNTVACVTIFAAFRISVRRRRDLVVVCLAFLVGCALALRYSATRTPSA